MARRINHDKGIINAKAEGSDDDVTVRFDKVKAVTAKAVLVKVDGEEVWIPFSQLVDLFPGDSEMIITEWIAGEKGLN